MVEHCPLIPETRVQLPCLTPWCDSISDMSIFLAKKKTKFLFEFGNFLLLFFRNWLIKFMNCTLDIVNCTLDIVNPDALISFMNLFGEMLISPKCFHKINAPRNLGSDAKQLFSSQQLLSWQSILTLYSISDKKFSWTLPRDSIGSSFLFVPLKWISLTKFIGPISVWGENSTAYLCITEKGLF